MQREAVRCAAARKDRPGRQGAHVARSHRHLRGFVTDLITRAAADHRVRTDVDPDELAGYCLHALTAAGGLPSTAAVGRLVDLTLSGLRPPP